MINNIVTEVFNFNIYAYYLLTNRGTLVVLTVYVLHHTNYIEICNVDVVVDDVDRFDFFFYFEIYNLTSYNFFFFNRQENSYLLFHAHFSLILFIFLVLKIVLIPDSLWC